MYKRYWYTNIVYFMLMVGSVYGAADFSFIADSDMQLGSAEQTAGKKGHVSAIKKLIQNKENNAKVLLIPGDLIDGVPSSLNASNYVAKTGQFVDSIFKKKQESAKSTIEKQFSDFRRQWFNSLRKTFDQTWNDGKEVKAAAAYREDRFLGKISKAQLDLLRGSGETYIYATAGNHEYYDYYLKTVTDWLKGRHGGHIYYSFDKEGIHFCCLGLVPDSSMYEWFKKDMDAHKGKPTVLFFHYNLRGNTSRWWSRTAIEKFWEQVKPYKSQIKLIVHGHNHFSYTTDWKGIPVIAVGGKEFAMVSYDKKSGDFTVTFYTANAQGYPEVASIQEIDHKKWPDDTKKMDDEKRVERQWNWNLTHRKNLGNSLKSLGGQVVTVATERVKSGVTKVKSGTKRVVGKVKGWFKK